MTFLTIDDIDKSIYEHLRKEVVLMGYLPDILDADYEAQREVIRTSKGQLIDVFAPAPWQSRDMKELSRFVIDRVDTIKGKLFGGGTIEERIIENGVERIKVFNLPDNSRTLVYEVRFATDNADYELLAHDIIAKVFGMIKRLSCLSEREGTEGLDFRIVWKGEYNASKYDFYERVFTFHVEDLFLEMHIEENERTFSPIVEIRVDIKENNQAIVTEIFN
jgi:hypothetical protein